MNSADFKDFGVFAAEDPSQENDQSCFAYPFMVLLIMTFNFPMCKYIPVAYSTDKKRRF